MCPYLNKLIYFPSYDMLEHTLTYGKCTTPNGEQASCIHLEQCTFLYNKVLNSGLLKDEDREFLSRSQCGSIGEKILICCSAKHVGEQQTQVTRGSLPEPGVCGNSLATRIYGGTVTKIDQFPWTALILYDTGNGVGHNCGGSLINNRYVLTAAHCIRSSIIPSSWIPISVRLGEWDTSTDRDCQKDTRGVELCADPHVDIPIERITVHENYIYSSRNQKNDIALIRLSRNVNYTDFIRPICLPIKDILRSISFDRMSMDIAGWGLTEKGRTSNFKLRAIVPGTPLSGCQLLYGGRYSVQLDNSQICAGGQLGVDSCNGDSGGGLVALDASNKSLNYYYIAGIISFGPTPCGLKGWPGVYTKVSNYIDWIQENIYV